VCLLNQFSGCPTKGTGQRNCSNWQDLVRTRRISHLAICISVKCPTWRSKSVNGVEVVDRLHLFVQLDEYCRERYVELGQRKLERPVIKSYVFETGRFPRQCYYEFETLGSVHPIDEKLFEISDEKGPIGYLEDLNRFKFFYTLLPTAEIEADIKRLVRESQFLDHLWLSGEMFRVLFDLVVRSFKSFRFVRAVMGYQPIFEDFRDLAKDTVESMDRYDNSIDERLEESPTSRLRVSNRLERVQRLIELLRPAPEFRNMVMLRIPALSVAGGHEFYSDGKVTNRSSSFLEHRQLLKSVVTMYGSMTELIEDMTWLRSKLSPDNLHQFAGNPVVLRFKKPLFLNTFCKFLDLTFNKGRGPFRLCGNLLERGKNCYHFYGLDLHLAHEIFLELTPSRFLVLLPEGTCGNIIHRLVTNVQKYLCPEMDVFVGSKPYMEIAKEAFSGLAFEKPAGPD